MRAATGEKPSTRACSTEKPVVAKPIPKMPTMEVPTTPAKRSRLPAALAPATLPVLLAAGPSGIQAGEAGDRGGPHAGEALTASGGVGAGNPPGLVGRGSQRNPGGAAGYEVHDFGAVAGGVDAVQIGLHAVVGADGAGAADLDAGLHGHFHVRLEPGGDHHQIAVDVRHAAGLYGAGVDAAAQLHAMFF